MAMEQAVSPASKDRPAIWAYVYWLVVGALIGLGIVALLTIGLILLLVGVGLAIIGNFVPALRNSSAAAAMAGASAPVFYLAWLNRGGPGEVCTGTASSGTCTDAWSPWPFVVVALLLVAASILMARSARR